MFKIYEFMKIIYEKSSNKNQDQLILLLYFETKLALKDILNLPANFLYLKEIGAIEYKSKTLFFSKTMLNIFDLFLQNQKGNQINLFTNEFGGKITLKLFSKYIHSMIENSPYQGISLRTLKKIYKSECLWFNNMEIKELPQLMVTPSIQTTSYYYKLPFRGKCSLEMQPNLSLSF